MYFSILFSIKFSWRPMRPDLKEPEQEESGKQGNIPGMIFIYIFDKKDELVFPRLANSKVSWEIFPSNSLSLSLSL